MLNFTDVIQRLKQVCKVVLEYAILSVFFLGPTYAQLKWDWLYQSFYGVFAIIVPIYLTIALWLLMGLPGLSTVLRDSRRWWLGGSLLLAVWAWLSGQWSLDRELSLSTAGAFATILLFAWAATCASPSARKVSIALMAGIALQIIVSIAQFSLQHSLGLIALGEYQLHLSNKGVALVAAGVEHLMRPYGLANHPNTLGGYIAFGLLCMSGWLGEKANKTQYIVWVVFVLGMWGLWLSFSRSAWGAFVVGVIILCVLYWLRRAVLISRSKIIGVALTALVVSAVFIVTYGRFVITRAGVNQEVTELRSVSDRRYYTGIALQAIFQHPIAGIGMGTFADFAQSVIDQSPYANDFEGDYVHNVPLLIWSELGLVGFLIWLFTLLAWFIVVCKNKPDLFTAGLVAGVIALLAAGLLDHYIWTMPHFIAMLWSGMGISLSRVKPVQPGIPG